MKKKLIALTACAAICLTTGCGAKNETSSAPTAVSTPDTGRRPETSSTVSQPNSSTAESTSSSSAAESTPSSSAAESTPSSSTAESTSEPNVSAPNVESGKIVRGKWNGNVFTSDFFGLTLTIDSSCEKGTDEMLAMLNGLNDMSDANFLDAVEKSKDTAVYDMYAMYNEMGSNIMLGYSKYKGISLDDYFEANIKGLELSGMFENVRTEKLNVSGKSQPCVYTTLSMGEVEISQAMVFYKNGDYFAIATFSAMSDGELREMITNVLG